MKKREVRLIVLRVFNRHHCEENNNYYDVDVWREIFRAVYKEDPISTLDSRWDELFAKGGLAALRFVKLYKRLCRS